MEILRCGERERGGGPPWTRRGEGAAGAPRTLERVGTGKCFIEVMMINIYL